MENSCLVDIDVSGCNALFEGTLVLAGCLLLLNLGYPLRNRVQNEILEASVDEFERLWQLVKVDARVRNEAPVIFWLHFALLGRHAGAR